MAARFLAGMAFLALLAGCSSYRNGMDAVRSVMHRPAQLAPTPESVAAKPYFQLQITSPYGQAILIFGGVEDGVQGWYARNGQAVFLMHGVVVRTIGLLQNLDGTLWPSGNPFAAGLQKLDASLETVRVVDWSPGYRYGVTVQDRLTPAGMEDVNILGTLHHLRRIDEQLSAPSAGFSGVNHYWVDPVDGFVWKSHQVVAQGFQLDLVQLRPYKDAAQ